MAINPKALGKSVMKGIDSAATEGGVYVGKGLQKLGMESAEEAARLGKYATYGAMGVGALGVVGNLDEYQYGIGNGIAQTLGGSLGGAGLGAVGGLGIGAVAASIAKGLR